jgi:hypothetical protein
MDATQLREPQVYGNMKQGEQHSDRIKFQTKYGIELTTSTRIIRVESVEN